MNYSPYAMGGTGAVQHGHTGKRWAFIVCFVWPLLLTLPLIFHLGDSLPRGQEPVGTVPLFNLWTLQWNFEQLRVGYSNYWNAPIFAPANGTFALSEIQILSGWLAAPIWLVTGSAVVAFNFLFLLFLALNGWLAYLLLREWKLPPKPSLAAALLIESLPFVVQEMGVLQLLAIFGFLWSLLFLVRLLGADQTTRWNWVGLAAGLPITFWTCSYYGLFSLLFLPIAWLVLWDRRIVSRRRAALVAGCVLLSLSIAAPLILAQRRILADQRASRTSEEIRSSSAHPLEYLKWGDGILYTHILGQEPLPGRRLFPGFALPILAVIGLVSRSGPKPGGDSRTKKYLVVAIVVASLLSLGPNLSIGSWAPYQLIEFLPGFGQLRSPYRFAAFAHVHIALLAAWGLAQLRNTWWLPVIFVTAALETMSLPLRLDTAPDLSRPAPWHEWLGEQEQPRVLLLPLPASPRIADYDQTVRWMVEQPLWGGEMVNGYSGFFPPDYVDVRSRLANFPTADGIQSLREREVDYVVVHHRLDAAARATVERMLRLVYYDNKTDVGIYELKLEEPIAAKQPEARLQTYLTSPLRPRKALSN